MRQEEFGQWIKAMHQRIAGLNVAAEVTQAPSQELAASLQKLHAALDELQVAQEELRQQNESLLASRQTAEAQRQRYQDLFEFAPDGYLVTDMEGTIWEANRAAAVLLHTEQSLLTRMPLTMFIAEEDRPAFREQLGRLRGLEGIQEGQVRLRPRRGAPIDAAVRVASIRDREDRLFGLRWLLRDVTEHKQIEKRIRNLNQELEHRVQERTKQLETANQLKDEWLIREQAARSDTECAQQRLAFLVEASHALASSLDYETVLQRVARLAVSRLAAWCCVHIRAEQGGRPTWRAAHRDAKREQQAGRLLECSSPAVGDVDAVEEAELLRRGEPVFYPKMPAEVLQQFAPTAECLALFQAWGARSGMLVPLQARGCTLGAILLVLIGPEQGCEPDDLSLAVDFANRAAAAIDNARLYRDVHEANRHKNEFLAMLAHELRNPLAPIRNAVQILRQKGLPRAEVRQACAVIDRQTQNMVRLVDDLLDVSRITRGKIELRKETVELATIVERALEDMRPVIEEQRHQMTVSLPATPVRFEADPARLEQVLSNLLHNAAKYTEPGGRIDLAAEQAGNEVVWRVRDTGIGITPEMLPRVFDLFAQSERALDRAQGGLGIGLTLVRNLVEMHGGTIRATSAGPGQGSEFIVRLPLGQVAAPPPAPPAEAPALNERSVRVLLVDDNADAAETLAMLLQLWGHEVHLAHDGPKALALALAHSPEVVLLDIGLPGMTGYELAQRLRQEIGLDRALLVAVTGYGQAEDRRHSHEAGFNLHLVKPVNPTVLRDILAQSEALVTQGS